MNDTNGLVGTGVVSVTILPIGQCQFNGIVSLSTGLPTSGSTALLVSGNNFLPGSLLTLRYSNAALKAANRTYSTPVRTCLPVLCSRLTRHPTELRVLLTHACLCLVC